MAWGIGAGIIGGAALGALGSIAGGYMASRENRRQQRKNRRDQRRYAQHGISWRVNDAIRAGLHPLAALGVSVPGFQSQYGEEGMGRGVMEASKQMGQGISRASMARLTEAEIANKNAKTLLLLEEVKRAGQGNYKMTDPAFGIGSPMGQGTVGGQRQQVGPVYENVPAPMSDTLGVQSGWWPWEKRFISKEGFATFTISDTEVIEENAHAKGVFYAGKIGELGRSWRAYIKNNPQMVEGMRKYVGQPPAGTYWVWRYGRGQFQAVPQQYKGQTLPVHKRERRPSFQRPYRGYKPKFEYGPGTP